MTLGPFDIVLYDGAPSPFDIILRSPQALPAIDAESSIVLAGLQSAMKFKNHRRIWKSQAPTPQLLAEITFRGSYTKQGHRSPGEIINFPIGFARPITPYNTIVVISAPSTAPST